MNRRHAHQIRAGINAARLAEIAPNVRPGLRQALAPLSRKAFDQWERNQPHRKQMRLVNLLTNDAKRFADEYKVAREFINIINYNRGSDA